MDSPDYKMLAAKKVRLVRCPNCRNILPEFDSYTLYQCGVCATILKAKARNPKPSESDEQGKFANRLEDSSGETFIVNHAGDEDSPKNIIDVNGDRNNTSISNLVVVEEEEEESVIQKDCIYGEHGKEIHESEKSIDERDDISPSSSGVRSSSKFVSDGSTTIDDHLEKLRVAEDDVAKLSYFSDFIHERAGRKIRLKEEDSCELVSKMDELINHLSQFSWHAREDENDHGHKAIHSRPSARSCNLAAADDYSLLNSRRTMHSAPLRRTPASFFPLNTGLVDTCNRRSHALETGQNFSPSHCYSRYMDGEFLRPVGVPGGRRHCRPVGGGAPFIVCCHCSELLQIPTKNWRRVRCSSCLGTIVVSVSGEKGKDSDRRLQPKASEGGNLDGKKSSRASSSSSYLLRPSDVSSNTGFLLRPPPGAPLKMHFDYSSNSLGVVREDVGGAEKVRGLVGRIKRGLKDLHRFGGF